MIVTFHLDKFLHWLEFIFSFDEYAAIVHLYFTRDIRADSLTFIFS